YQAPPAPSRRSSRLLDGGGKINVQHGGILGVQLTRVTVKTAQRWRCDGDGPPYRNEVGIRYPVAWYWDWRHKGRQTMTAQRSTRAGTAPCRLLRMARPGRRNEEIEAVRIPVEGDHPFQSKATTDSD